MKNLRLLRKENGISQKNLGEKFGLSQSQIYAYEKNEYEPDIQTLKLLADFFDTSVDYLIGYTDIRHKIEPVKEFELNEKEAELIEKYRNLNESAKSSIMNMIDTLLDSGK